MKGIEWDAAFALGPGMEDNYLVSRTAHQMRKEIAAINYDKTSVDQIAKL